MPIRPIWGSRRQARTKLSMPHTARVCVPVHRIPLVWPQTGPGWLSLVIVPELVVILIAVSAVAKTQLKQRDAHRHSLGPVADDCMLTDQLRAISVTCARRRRMRPGASADPG
jgi:hypothetical protein